MKLLLITGLMFMVGNCVFADWRCGVDKTTGAITDVAIGGKIISMIAGAPGGVCVEEIASRDGKAVNIGKTGRFSTSVVTRRSGNAVMVDAEIRDTRGGDSAADVFYQIPVDIDGWTWCPDIIDSAPAGEQTQDESPIAVLVNMKTGAGLAVAITPETPCIFISGCSKAGGLFVKAKVGFSELTNPPSRAKISFVVYPVDARWGMRSALKQYYTMFPKAYEGHSKVNGLWIFHGKATTAPNPTQFGFHSLGELEEAHKIGRLAVDILTPEEIAREKKWGIEIYPYVIPGQREVGFLDSLKNEGKIMGMPEQDGTSDVLETHYTTAEAMKLLENMKDKNFTLTQHIQSIPDYITTVKNSLMIGADGDVITRPRITSWSDKSLTFPMNPNPFIPGGEKKLNAGMEILNECRKWLEEKPWDGIYVDSLYRWGAYVNYRRDHFAYARYGLTYGGDGKPCLDNSLEHLTFLDELSKLVRSKGGKLTANGVRQRCFFHAQRLDVSGSEFGTNVTVEGVAARRAMVYQKPYMSMNHIMKGREVDRRYLGRCFLFGVYGCSDMPYFNTPDYLKVKDIYDTYLPIQREMVPLGWEPVTYARALARGVLTERFGSGHVILFSIYRDKGGAKATDLEVDCAQLDLEFDKLKVVDPVSGKSLVITKGEQGSAVVQGIPLSADGMGVVRIEMGGS